MVPAFVQAGIKGIALLASNATKLAAVEQSVKESNPSIETLTCALDISDAKAVESAFEKIKETFGHANVLVNTAGAMTGDGPKLHETDPEQWWKNFVGRLTWMSTFVTVQPSNKLVIGNQRKRNLSHDPLLSAPSTRPRHAR